MKGVGSEGAAGHFNVTYSYALNHQGRCISFTCLLKLVNAGIVEMPLAEFDTSIEENKMEAQLSTIKLQE